MSRVGLVVLPQHFHQSESLQDVNKLEMFRIK